MTQSYLIASERKVLLVELYLCQYKRCRTHQFENTKVIRVWRPNTRAHCHDSASQWWLGSGVYHLSLFKVRQKKNKIKKKYGRQIPADRVTPQQQAGPDICVCECVWCHRYSLPHLDSVLPSALSSPADLCVLCFLSFQNCWRWKRLFRAFHFFIVSFIV